MLVMRTAMWIGAVALGAALLVSPTAMAGELMLGAESLETDGKGKLTKAAREKTITELEASPGDESWTLHLWARIDSPAVGPLYLEFYRTRNDKRLVAHRIEFAEYGGDKYLSMDVELFRTDGFKVGETVDMAFVQNVGGRDATKAKAKLTLLASSVQPEPEPDEEPESEPEAAAPAPEPTAPPPVAPADKKGCRVGDPTGVPWLMVLPLWGLAMLRRR